MTKFKDVANLYLGCECKLDREKVKLSASHIEFWNDELKPLLRPLDSMTEDELLHIATEIYKEVYNHDPEFENVRIVTDGGKGFMATEKRESGHDDWHYGLTVAGDGINFSVNGDFLHISYYKIVAYLLSKHFDLFSLIPNGEAIDKTKTQNNG